MEKVEEGRPLGEMLMWAPVRGAEAVKKTCWDRAWGFMLVEVGNYGVLRVGGGDGGPILLGCRGLSRRIVPCFCFTITYCYTKRIIYQISMNGNSAYFGED